MPKSYKHKWVKPDFYVSSLQREVCEICGKSKSEIIKTLDLDVAVNKFMELDIDFNLQEILNDLIDKDPCLSPSEANIKDIIE